MDSDMTATLFALTLYPFFCPDMTERWFDATSVKKLAKHLVVHYSYRKLESKTNN